MSGRIVVTAGDPSGIGPEVAVKALDAWPGRRRALLIGEAASLGRTIDRYAPGFDVELLPLKGLEAVPVGTVSAAGGRAAIAALDLALDLLRTGGAVALVTAPINKAAIRLAGFSEFTGHTGYLAERANVAGNIAMLLVSERLQVIHVSTHQSLRSATMLAPSRIDRVIDLAVAHLRETRAPEPSVLVAGLNPHAGEQGAFGHEDDVLIAPAVQRARLRHPGIGLAGPLPPDVVFVQGLDRPGAIVVAMYHDQGHIPVKLIARDTAVNLTLGLPFVRTSADHGTAHDIADLGLATSTSMRRALELAAQMTSDKPSKR